MLLMLCGFGPGPSWFISSMLDAIWQTRISAGAIEKPWRAIRAALPRGQRLDDQSAFATAQTAH
jgi:hypothetical protein